MSRPKLGYEPVSWEARVFDRLLLDMYKEIDYGDEV